MKNLFLSILCTLCLLLCSCTPTPASTPDADLFTPAQTQPRVEKIFTTTNTTFALLEDGSVWYWGMRYKPEGKITETISTFESGALTEKEVTYNDVALVQLPQKLEFDGIELKHNVKDIVNCGLATFVLLKNGDLYSFGANTVAGILGDGTFENRATPKKILSGVSQIKCNLTSSALSYPLKHFPEYQQAKQQGTLTPLEEHKYGSGYSMYALKENGELYSWGYNFTGELYNGTREDSAFPIKILDNIKALHGDKQKIPFVAEMFDGTLLLSFQSGNDETNSALTLKSAFKAKAEILTAYDVWRDGKNFVGLLYENGELWHYNANGQGSLFEKDVKEYDGFRFLKADGTLYQYKDVDDKIKTDSNVKTFKDGADIYNDNSIYISDLNGNKYRYENVFYATGNYHINNQTGYLYARGDCNTNLGIELNPDEEFIEVPVQVLFPAGWNK